MPNAEDTLAGSLAFLRDGSERLQTSFAALHDDVRSGARSLDRADHKVDCEQLAASLFEMRGSRRAMDPAQEDIAPPLGELLAVIAGTYTMAREREVHRPFADEVESGPASPAFAMPDDDLTTAVLSVRGAWPDFRRRAR